MTAIKDYIFESQKTLKQLLSDDGFLVAVEEAAAILNECLGSDHKLLLAGNGGSAADAQHIAAEITGRYRRERRGYPAVALTTDSSALTAIGNDYGFEKIFSRQVEALGQRGDVLICISTSGNSPNLVEAAKVAKKNGIMVVGLLGRDGGAIKDLVDCALVVPSEVTSHIQEAHIVIYHYLCDVLEEKMLI